MGFDLEFKANNLHFREFIRFGVETKLSPYLVTSELLMAVFRISAKMQQLNERTITEGTDIPDKNIIQFISLLTFKKALVRISVLCF